MNTYRVVHFLEENTVEAVLSTWFSSNKNACTWPKNCTNPLRLIGKNVKPNDDEFTFFKARMLY